ncbi:MAG: hypothetical protein NXH87_17055 [Rhodobiaceae bacterium]|nr:hypothetical protein [Rhodobiaceae bacterium]
METLLSLGISLLWLVFSLVILWVFYRIVRGTYAAMRYYAAINGLYTGGLTNEECREAYDRWNKEPHPDAGYWFVFVSLMILAGWAIWAVVSSPPPGF